MLAKHLFFAEPSTQLEDENVRKLQLMMQSLEIARSIGHSS